MLNRAPPKPALSTEMLPPLVRIAEGMKKPFDRLIGVVKAGELRMFNTFVRWSRYGGLFHYDESEQRLGLDVEHV